MQKKIYVSGMFDNGTAEKVNALVKAVNGVTNAAASPEKSQVLVDYDESVDGIEDALNAAIASAGVEVLN
ncbi:MAG: heavy-metal-associated domain-containing protein [Treponema sp.]